MGFLCCGATAAVYGEVDGDTEFFVYDDKYFDRTQKVETQGKTHSFVRPRSG